MSFIQNILFLTVKNNIKHAFYILQVSQFPSRLSKLYKTKKSLVKSKINVPKDKGEACAISNNTPFCTRLCIFQVSSFLLEKCFQGNITLTMSISIRKRSPFKIQLCSYIKSQPRALDESTSESYTYIMYLKKSHIRYLICTYQTSIT